MNRLLLTGAAMLAAAQISAGVRIETVSRDIQTMTIDGGTDVVLVQDGMLRSNHAKSSSNTTIIKDATIYVLDDAEKIYYVVDEAAKKKLAMEATAELKQMQEHVKNMPPERRAMDDEFCVVPYASLPGKEDFAKAFREFWDAFGSLTAGFTSTADYPNVRQSIDGYPVRVRSFDDAGQLRANELVLTKWVEESLPASTFEVPAGYKKKAPPKAGD